MEWTKRMDTGSVRTEEGNHRLYTPAEVVNVRFVCTEVEASPLGTVSSGGKIGHHPRPEQIVSR
jgi:hypothetical protein